ncbi:hypothetical protein ACFLQO_01250 [Candidatus Aenigmatarchaeota archaeon]
MSDLAVLPYGLMGDTLRSLYDGNVKPKSISPDTEEMIKSQEASVPAAMALQWAAEKIMINEINGKIIMISVRDRELEEEYMTRSIGIPPVDLTNNTDSETRYKQ